jgi:uncharacterized protein
MENFCYTNPVRDSPSPSPLELLDRLLASYRSVLVAYSGGVDSAFLLWRACRVPGLRVEGVLADSPSLKRSELDSALAFARAHGLPVRVLATHETEDSRYQANPANRCFFCKAELFQRMEALARSEGWNALAYGEHADDLGHDRPGRLAAAQFSVVAPLREAGIGKAAIRAWTAEAGLSVADKPAQPCLASRIPTGQPVTPGKLRQIEAAEAVLEAEGFRIVRVRHWGDHALVQVAPEEIPRLLAEPLAGRVRHQLGVLGFPQVTLDPQGYRGASLA